MPRGLTRGGTLEKSKILDILLADPVRREELKDSQNLSKVSFNLDGSASRVKAVHTLP